MPPCTIGFRSSTLPVHLVQCLGRTAIRSQHQLRWPSYDDCSGPCCIGRYQHSQSVALHNDPRSEDDVERRPEPYPPGHQGKRFPRKKNSRSQDDIYRKSKQLSFDQRSKRSTRYKRASPSDALIEALTESGADASLPYVSLQRRPDYSYTNPLKLGAKTIVSKERLGWSDSQTKLQGVLASYIRCTHGHSPTSPSQLSESGDPPFWLDTKGQALLERRHYSVADVREWASLLMNPNPAEAARRILASSKAAEDGVGSVHHGIPPFVLRFLLRRSDLGADALKSILISIWNEIGIRIARQPKRHQRRNPTAASLQLSDTSFSIIPRLLRHACRAWPSALVSIAALVTTHIRLQNDSVARSKAKGEEVAVLSRINSLYNIALCLMAAPSYLHPMHTISINQRAQFDLLIAMAEHDPPLTISRQGYRAITSVLLAHKKTEAERRWARLKAKSWPPWKEEKIGADADIGPEHGVSRALQAIQHAREAGYGNRTWERIAKLLSGWDTDGSPTIQTRTVLGQRSEILRAPGASDIGSHSEAPNSTDDNHQLTKAGKDYFKEQSSSPEQSFLLAEEGHTLVKQRVEELPEERVSLISEEAFLGFPSLGEDSTQPPIWASRIKSTRTKQEAWAHFLAYQDACLPPSGEVYFAMLSKLSSAYERHPWAKRLGLTDGSSQYWDETHLPGDSPTVYTDPESPKEATYVRTPPPTFEKLVEDMFANSIVPQGRFMAFLLEHTDSLRLAIKYIEQGCTSTPSMKALLAKHPELEVQFRQIPPAIFAAYIKCLTHTVNVSPSSGGEHRSDLHDYVMHDITPLACAIRLVTARMPTEMPAWRWIILCLANLDRPITSESRRVSHYRGLGFGIENENFATNHLENYACLRHVVQTMESGGVLADVEVLRLSCVGLSRATFGILQDISQSTPTKRDIYLQGDLAHSVNTEGPSVSDLWQELKRAQKYGDEITDMFSKVFGGNTASDGEDEAIPASWKIPRLLAIPWAHTLHIYMRLLGSQQKWSAMLELLKWMVWYERELADAVSMPANGPRQLRRTFTCARTFLEGAWIDVLKVSEDQFSLEDPRPLRAPTEVIEIARGLIDSVSAWGGWPVDEEVLYYCRNGPFPGSKFTPAETDWDH